ncbi:MAG: MFS transporter [Synergistaceae bacterium]|nr:MFS transporter [Synergistaceae bacterium]
MRSPWALFAILCLSYCFGTIVRISSVLVLPELAKEIGIGAALLGFLSSLFFFAYAFTQSMWGSICGRIGPVRACSIGLFIASFGSYIFIFANNSFLLGLSRLFSGLGTAALFIGTLIFAAVAFTSDRYPLLVGLTMSLGNIGTAIAVAPLGILLDTIGVTGVFLCLSSSTALLACILWFSRRYDPYEEKIGYTNKTFAFSDLFKDTRDALFMILSERTLLLIVGTWATTTATIITLQSLWGVIWVETASGASVGEARGCVTWVGIGLILGAISGGFITKYAKGKSNVFILICFCSWISWLTWCALSFFSADIFYFNISGFSVGLLSAFCMVFASSTIKEMVPASKTAAIVGMSNMLNFIAVIILQGVSGIIIGLFPKDALGNYPTIGYETAFGIILLCQLLIYIKIPRGKTLMLREK